MGAADRLLWGPVAAAEERVVPFVSCPRPCSEAEGEEERDDQKAEDGHVISADAASYLLPQI